MSEFNGGGGYGLNQNGNGKHNAGLRNPKAGTNEITNNKTNGHALIPPTSINSNGHNVSATTNGNGPSRKTTNNLQNNLTPAPTTNPARRRTTDPLPAEPTVTNNGQGVLNGFLTAFTPSAILSLLNIQRQSGALHLHNSNGASGYIYVQEGEVWDARLGTVTGAYALFQLFGWKQGQFWFEINGPVPPKRTIEASLPVLQVRATLWLDNMSKYNQAIPTVSHRIFIANDPPGGVVIEPYQWAILTKIVARPLSIAQLADELDQDLMTVTRIAADLVRVGVATVLPPETNPNIAKG